MKSAVVIDCVRTPIGRAHKEKGWFRDVRSDDLAVACIKTLVERTGIDPALVEDVILGNTQQTGEQGLNAARSIALMAGLPVESGGATVNRLCGSSLQALNQASHAIAEGFEDVQIVGGLEHMQHLPMDHGLDLNPKLFQRTSDGAAALLVMSDERAKTLGLKPLVRVRATAVAGVEPCVMGTGPVPAVKKALSRAGLSLSDIDLVELNEAFAAQALACIRMLGLDEDKVNVRGGAIAIGHPLGASGARIATTLINAMIDRGAKLGLATMCIGLGQGIATIFERV